MINIETAFNELGIDAATGVELMDWLQISPIDLGDPTRFSKFHSVIDYFKQFPVDTQRYLIRKAINNKNVDKLNHVWEYAELLKRKSEIEKATEKIRLEGSALGPESDAVLRMANAQRELDAKEQFNKVVQEIEIYEQ